MLRRGDLRFVARASSAPDATFKGMGLFKSAVDKLRGKKDELEKKAAKKAARVAIEQGAKAARGALDSVGNAIEKAIFGDVEGGTDDAYEEEAHEEKAKPDPFAALKAAEAKKREEGRREELIAKEPTERQARNEAEIDAELAAMKKRLGK